ncbi:MAG: hypothetical protein IJI43_00860 [Bacilli bacterium]|nr:hypothetical protein [Bacilli bacterium]
MKDPEFIELKNRTLITVLVVLIFASTLIAFMIRLLNNGNNLYKKISNKETMYVLLVSKECKRCNAVEDVLFDNKIKYYTLDKNDGNTERIYNMIELDDEVTDPCLFYIKKGKLDSYLDNIDDQGELEDFIDR